VAALVSLSAVIPALVKYGHSSPRLATATPSTAVRCPPLAVVMSKVTR
jgi:hypothetical protein